MKYELFKSHVVDLAQLLKIAEPLLPLRSVFCELIIENRAYTIEAAVDGLYISRGELDGDVDILFIPKDQNGA